MVAPRKTNMEDDEDEEDKPEEIDLLIVAK